MKRPRRRQRDGGPRVGDSSTVRANAHCDDYGPLETPFGTFPATDLKIDEVLAYFVELDAGGRAVRIRHYYDAVPVTRAIMAGSQDLRAAAK